MEGMNLTLSMEMASLEESFINFHFKELKEELDTFAEEEDEDEDNLGNEALDPSFMRHNDINIFLQSLAILIRKIRVASREWISIIAIVIPSIVLAF